MSFKIIKKSLGLILSLSFLLVFLAGCKEKKQPEATTTTEPTEVVQVAPSERVTVDPHTVRLAEAKAAYNEGDLSFPDDVLLQPKASNFLDLRMADHQRRELLGQRMRANAWAILAGMPVPAQDLVLDEAHVAEQLEAVPPYSSLIISPIALWFSLAGYAELPKPEAVHGLKLNLYSPVLREDEEAAVQNTFLAALAPEPGDESFFLSLANVALLAPEKQAEQEGLERAKKLGMPVLPQNPAAIQGMQKLYTKLGLEAKSLNAERFNESLYLLSALVFEDAWYEDFDPALTSTGDFHGETKETKVAKMYRQADVWEYTEDEVCQKLAIPLLSGARLIFWQPQPTVTIDELLLLLASDKHALNAYQESLWLTADDREEIHETRDVRSSLGEYIPGVGFAWKDPELEFAKGEVYLPKFSFKRELSLYSPYEAMLERAALPDGTAVSDIHQLVDFELKESLKEAPNRDGLRLRQQAKARGMESFVFDLSRPFLIELRYHGLPLYQGVIRDLEDLVP